MANLKENQAYLIGGHVRAVPVVEVVVESSVTRSKLESFDEILVIHKIEAVHDVHAVLLGKNESIVHKLSQGSLSGNVVVRIGSAHFLVDGMTENRGREDVERAEIGDLLCSRIFNDVSIDDSLNGADPVKHISFIEVHVEREFLEVGAQQLGNLRDIFGSHFANSSGLGSLYQDSVSKNAFQESLKVKRAFWYSKVTYLRQGVEFLCHRHSDLAAQVRETNLNELLRVDRSMVVAAFSNVSGELDTGSVSGLPNIHAVDAARNFTDQDGSQALSAKLLVHAEEVDLSHAHRALVDVSGDRNTSNKTNEQLVS